MSGVGGPQSEIEALRNACEESREVLNHLNSTLDDTADKGVWTARTAIIILGLVVSAISIGGPPAPNEVSPAAVVFGGIGIVLLFVATLLGLGLYQQTQNIAGPGERARDAVRNSGMSEREWRLRMLEGYSDWIAFMDTETDLAGEWLYRSWQALTGSLIALSIGAVLSIFA